MARHSNAVPEYSSIWTDHVNLYLEVFTRALRRLQRVSVSGDEGTISLRLCALLAKECFEFEQKGRPVPVPQWEKPQQPQTHGEVTQGHIGKRPDFTCSFHDTSAKSLDDWLIPLHIECKRLGERTSARWILNTNYVTDGIARFDLQSHRYGNRASSGIMIGYIISMTPEQIQTQVNSCIKQKLPGVPLLEFALSDVPLQSRHRFARRHVKPTPFTLIHLWVDIRNNYQVT